MFRTSSLDLDPTPLPYQDERSRPTAAAGAAGISSPPKERRRLGKTHGRARKDGDSTNTSGARGAGGGRRREGGVDDGGPVLTPGGPGQGKPRKHTLSIAIPGSVVDNAQNRELKTYLVGAALVWCARALGGLFICGKKKCVLSCLSVPLLFMRTPSINLHKNTHNKIHVSPSRWITCPQAGRTPVTADV